MPNHVTHRVKVTGPADALAEFRATCIRRIKERDFQGNEVESEPTLDFNTLVPMPECIKATERSSNSSMGLFALGVNGGGFGVDYLTIKWVRDLGITTREQFREYVEREHPKAIEAAQASLKAVEETGFADWYNWSIANWGTKWNAYSYSEVNAPGESGRMEFVFDTAWSTPEPIFAAIAERFPTLSFDVAGFDEGWGFAVAGRIEGGECNLECVDADATMYALVYGEAPETDDDDDDDEDEDSNDDKET